jgi:hypothetical protein
MSRIARAWRVLIGTDDESEWRQMYEDEVAESRRLREMRDAAQARLDAICKLACLDCAETDPADGA